MGIRVVGLEGHRLLRHRRDDRKRLLFRRVSAGSGIGRRESRLGQPEVIVIVVVIVVFVVVVVVAQKFGAPTLGLFRRGTSVIEGMKWWRC